MASAERHGKGWRVTYKDPSGQRIRESGFRTKDNALRHGRRQELAVEDGVWVDPRRAITCFGDYLKTWLIAQDLELNTTTTYRSLIRNQIEPTFGSWAIGDIDQTAVKAWIKGLHGAGFSESTVRSARGLLHTIFEDAVTDKLVALNPARLPRRRGKVAGRAETPASLWAEPEQVLAIARRMPELTHREDEYVMVLTMAYTGMRWGEVIGLEREQCQPLGRKELRVEWQLSEVDGRFYRLAPKGGGSARRSIRVPDFLNELLTDQVERARPCETDSCGCGNRAYLFFGPEGAHPRRSNFSRRYWRPACDGIPEADRQKPRTGRRGPRPKRKPDWEAIAPGLTPHDLRHSHKTWMIEDGTPEVAQAERLGHQIPGVRGIYSHVSDAMREQIVTALQARWERSVGRIQRLVRAVG
jgi:integrase